ncbi:hypothetical protein [Leucobacter chromiireducens]|uniref:hypothetical protein n=1 Tax=Leucobacter chromiireducens TaxID=283877 RepID=UPI003F821ED1
MKLWRGLSTLFAAAVCCGTISGCVPAAQVCISWASYASVETAIADADLVVGGTVRPTDETAPILGENVAVYEIDVRKVFTGDVIAGDSLRFASTPSTCSGNEGSAESDPLNVPGEVVVFLARDESDIWRTLSPFAGVMPGAEMPELTD